MQSVAFEACVLQQDRIERLGIVPPANVAEQARIIQDDLVASHSHECVGQPGEVDLALVEA